METEKTVTPEEFVELLRQYAAMTAKHEKDREELIAKIPEMAEYFRIDEEIEEAEKGIRESQERMRAQFERDFNDMQEEDK